MGAPADWDRYVSSSSKAVVKALASSIYWGTRKTFPVIWIGRGWDTHTMSGDYPDSGQWPDEHGTGRALDIICAPEVGVRSAGEYREAGEAVLAWLMANAKQMHIRHIIWQNRIWKTRYGTWTQLSGSRSGVSDRHEDHIHVFFEDIYGSIPALNFNTYGQEDLEMNEETANRIAAIVDHAVWSTHIPGAGRFDDVVSDLAKRVRELAQDLADVHRGGAEGYVPVNQELADTKSMVISMQSQLDKLSLAVESILEKIGQ
jgi:hypothetical protein